jgi:hypothetical protein
MTEIFLSYAHDDDDAPFDTTPGHVSVFDDTLQVELRKSGFGGKVTVWRDSEHLNAGGLSP